MAHRLRSAIHVLTLAACFFGIAFAWADNQPIVGSGCVNASSATQLGSAKDHLSGRKLVAIGVDPSTRMLHTLKRNGHSVELEDFMEQDGLSPSQVGKLYVLLVGRHHIHSRDPEEAVAIARAKADGVPIVAEGFEKRDFKSLTGLGMESDAAIVQFAPGGRAQTITLVHHPKKGPTLASATDAVNRAIDKHVRSLPGATLDPTRQAYAENIWTVWFHTGNVVCTLPYYGPEDVNYPQTGNLDFGVQITLVAQTQPLEKAINLQYLGAGFTPLAPGVLPIDNNDYFKGAYTLSAKYLGQLTARYGAQLTGTADTVEPTTAVNAHTVTKTNGFSFGLNSSCGANTTGPNCSIGAGFNFLSQKQVTKTISERVIDAASSFGQIADPNGTICGDIANGCWKATHSVDYYLASTASSSGGYSIDLPNNNWYNFFAGINTYLNPIISTSDGDAVGYPCSGCSLQNPPDPPPGTVRDWPQWSSSSVLTQGEAGYTFSANYTGDLNLTAAFLANEGIFSLGTGPKEARLPNTYYTACIDLSCQTQLAYVLDLYEVPAGAGGLINIDANQVNYSGMPTCAMRQYTQQDLGIYEILNKTNHPLSIGQMNTSPFVSAPISTVADDYRGSDQWLLGVSATTVQPGQYQYVALCSSNQTTSAALELLYNNGSHANGAITFNGAGQPAAYNTAQVSYNATKRIFTVF